jgi:hypothetical protein
MKAIAPGMIELASPWLTVHAINETFGTAYTAEQIDEMDPIQLEAALAVRDHINDEKVKAIKKAGKGGKGGSKMR